MMGFVSLVGAGLGVKDHLTLRAYDRLARADLVLYDALVDDSLLNIASNAQRFYVGKRAGRHSMSQQTIQNLLIRYAREGKRVVRLKAGDPFILGRGGEEALALEAADVPYEVVPGLSSAVAGPAFAGIPLTHRKRASNFVMLSGHAASGYEPVLKALPPDSATLVILMGFNRRHAIIDTLREAGWADTTPAAIVAGAGTAQQSLWYGDLDALHATDFDPEGAPVTLVIGATVELANQIRGTSPVDDVAPSLEMRTHS
ncbi:MAG: uroporphyrinogen-III C-methyltransferase [Myxococcota bacterium]